jgi:NTE family protein
MTRRHFLSTLGSFSIASAAWASPASAQTPRRAPTAGAARKLGIALGAGSARGFAHIGALKALVEAGLSPEIITGTSAGSLVGVFYAAGFTPWQIEQVAVSVRDIDIVDLKSSSSRGMFTGEAMQKLVNHYLKDVPLENLKRRFGVVTTLLKTGEMRLLTTGDAGFAVRASCAIPGVFVPTLIGEEELVDGGLVSPLPVNAARQLGADVVIALDVGTKPQNPTKAGLYEVILQSFEIMGRSLSHLEAQNADFVIRPDTSRFSSTDFASRKEMIQAGYESTVAAMPALRRRLKQLDWS